MSYEYDEGSDIDNYEDEQVFQDTQQDKKDEMSESRIEGHAVMPTCEQCGDEHQLLDPMFQDNQQDKKDEMSESGINHGTKGFHMTFENGYTISVQYGRGNYCERRNDDMVFDQNGFLEEPSADEIISKDCEIAVWYDAPGGCQGYVQLSENETVRGWVPIEDLPQIMVYVQTGDFDAIRATE